jgi:hypothetical protein
MCLFRKGGVHPCVQNSPAIPYARLLGNQRRWGYQSSTPNLHEAAQVALRIKKLTIATPLSQM